MSFESVEVESDTGTVEGSEGKNEVIWLSLSMNMEDWAAAVADPAEAHALIVFINDKVENG